MKHTPSTTRTLTRAVTAAVACTASVALAASAQAAVPEAQTSAGALSSYLSGNADHFHTTFDGTEYADYGLTLDGVLALDSAGVGATESAAALAYVGDHLTDYIGDGGTSAYAGATAKALVAAEANHPGESGTLGGVDLVSRLQGLENTKGRFRDVSSYGDYSNTIGQSLALVALTRAGEDLTKESKVFLRLQQCPNGGFRQNMNINQCTDDSSADPDSTAFGIQALLTLPDNAKRAALIKDAALYLKGLQHSGGGIGDGVNGVPNANTTGVVAATMRAIGRNGVADKAVGFLTKLRFGCNFPAGLRGLTAYSVQAKADAKAMGDAATVGDQALRATTQAVPGFAGKGFAEITIDGATADAPTYACSSAK